MNNTRKITICAVFTALALILSIVESMLPLSAVVPGLKLGLANVVPLTLLYILGPVYAITTQALRILIMGFIRGNSITFLFSAFGGIASILVSSLIYKQKKVEFSIIGVSIIGAIVHNAAQFVAALLVLKNINIIWYIFVLTLFAVFSGILTAFISKYTIRALGSYVDKL